MSHPPEGLFGEKVDYSTAHISGKAKNGNVFKWTGEGTNGEEETIQHQWNEDRIIHTRKKSDGSIERTVYIGEFDFEGNTLFTKTSRLKYRADFYLTPTSTTYTGGTYLGNGEYEQTPRQTHIHQNVESGYLRKYDNNIPYPLGSENEHCRFEWKYAEIKDTSDLSMDGGDVCGTEVEGTNGAKTITDRQVLEKSAAGKYLPKNWWKDPFEIENNGSNDNDSKKDEHEEGDFHVPCPNKFKVKNIDKITNFNPSTDTLEIDTDSFGIDGSATFASGKNKKTIKKKLAKQDFDFLYDEKNGGLFFNENGSDKGFGDGGIIAILKGAPDMSASNLEFI